ncbi:Hypothetical predicted protein, partial [Podarcis lilfordi]
DQTGSSGSSQARHEVTEAPISPLTSGSKTALSYFLHQGISENSIVEVHDALQNFMSKKRQALFLRSKERDKRQEEEKDREREC